MPDLVTTPAVERFRRWGIVAWSLIGILVLAGVVVWVLTQVHEIFPPLVLALITIYVLNPVVSRLERRGVPRVFGSCLTYLLLLLVVVVVIALLVPSLINQGAAFGREFPHTWTRITHFSSGISRQLERRFHVHMGLTVSGRSRFANNLVKDAGGFLRGAVQTFALLIIGLVVGFYLLIDLPRMQRAASRLIPPKRRAEASEVASEISHAMGGFFRGQLLVALIVGIMSAGALRAIGLPYWLVIGLVAGFFNLVPLIGPFIGAIPAILIAAALKPPIYMLWAALALTLVQQIDNHFISPNVMRWTVRLHPVTVMLSLTAGAALLGFWGMLVAVPIVASVKMIVAHFWATRVPWGLEVFAEGDRMEGLGHEQQAPDDIVTATQPAVLPTQPEIAERPAVLGPDLDNPTAMTGD